VEFSLAAFNRCPQGIDISFFFYLILKNKNDKLCFLKHMAVKT
jgi:hypothetical protein